MVVIVNIKQCFQMYLEDKNMDCNNLCRMIDSRCDYCKQNYDVSSNEYRAKRPANDQYVYGYLVKDKNGNIQGILNKNIHYAELAWIKEETLEAIEG